jgi:hypothetical protein
LAGVTVSDGRAAFFSTARRPIMVAEEMPVGPLSEAARDTLKRLLQRLAESGRL